MISIILTGICFVLLFGLGYYIGGKERESVFLMKAKSGYRMEMKGDYYFIHKDEQ